MLRGGKNVLLLNTVSKQKLTSELEKLSFVRKLLLTGGSGWRYTAAHL